MQGSAFAEERATVNVVKTANVPADAPVVGTYYYPWFGAKPRPLVDDWDDTLRRRLVPQQTPAAGLYRSDDPAVVSDHLNQSRRAGLSFWATSWWGPGSATDRTTLEVILPHAAAQEFRFAVLYESVGRLGDMRHPNYDNWTKDLAYLSEHYFNRPNYLRINGRPVLFIYLTREYFRDKGEEALRKGREQFADVYLIGDDVFGGGYQEMWAKQFDAVTIYDVYGQSTGIHRATKKAVETLAANYAAAHATANAAGAAFIPTVAPGYNDGAVRPGHAGTPRYLVDRPGSHEGDLFRAMLRDAALPNLDDHAGRVMMVTSFNEWYEDSQIEATSGDAKPTTKDDSPSGDKLTGGDRYEDYGTLYLDILREAVDGPGGNRDTETNDSRKTK